MDFSPAQVTHAKRNYKPLFVIAVEGECTEPRYFGSFYKKLDAACLDIEIIPPNNGESAPKRVLEKLKNKNNSPLDAVESTRSFWMVIDRDTTRDLQFDSVVTDCREQRFELCVSNPAFEYWLLLHFEDGESIPHANEGNHQNTGKRRCSERVREYLHNFGKKITDEHWELLWANVQEAIRRARQQDEPPCDDYHRNRCGTTVYRLVEALLRYVPNTA